MRINAYILAADPAWIEASVLSYYDLVDTLVVSYDESYLGWTGLPIAVDECLTRLRAVDREGKIRYCPGKFASVKGHAMDGETRQRQCALDEASQDADWVIQLDTDELLADPDQFLACLHSADRQKSDGMYYPQRWLYCEIKPGHYLEWSTRFWRLSAGYPGAAAVRAGVHLRFARQIDGRIYKIGFRGDKPASITLPLEEAVGPEQAIYHYAWVRSEESMLHKSRISGHARDFDWSPELKRWMWSKRHPYLAMLTSALQRGPQKRHVRLVNISTKPILPSLGRSMHEGCIG